MDPEVSPPSSGNGAALAMSFAFLLIATVAMGVHFPGKTTDFRLPSPAWPPAAEALAAQNSADQQLLRDFPEDADEVAFVEALERFHREEVRLKGLTADAMLREKLTELEGAARRITGTRGPGGYRAALVRLAERFQRAVAGVRVALADESVRILDGGSGAEIPAIAEFQKLAGTMLVDSLRTGLLAADGRVEPGAMDVLRFLYLHRLSGVVREIMPRDRLLTPFEVVTVLKWKVEGHPGLAWKERKELVPEIQALDPTWPREKVLGMVCIRLGLFAQAITHFDRALLARPDEVGLRRLQELAERAVERSAESRP